jgi:hypothetical protein
MEMHSLIIVNFCIVFLDMAFRVFILFRVQIFQWYDFEELMKIPLKLEGDQHQGHGVKPP